MHGWMLKCGWNRRHKINHEICRRYIDVTTSCACCMSGYYIWLYYLQYFMLYNTWTLIVCKHINLSIRHECRTGLSFWFMEMNCHDVNLARHLTKYAEIQIFFTHLLDQIHQDKTGFSLGEFVHANWSENKN